MSQEVDIVLQDIKLRSNNFIDLDNDPYRIVDYIEINDFIDIIVEQKENGYTHIHCETSCYDGDASDTEIYAVEWGKETIEEAKERIMLENGRHRSSERDSRKKELAEYKRLKEKFETKPKA